MSTTNQNDQILGGTFSFFVGMGLLMAYFFALRSSDYGLVEWRSAGLIFLAFVVVGAIVEIGLLLVAAVTIIAVIYYEVTDHEAMEDIVSGFALAGVSACVSLDARFPDADIVGYLCPPERVRAQSDLIF